MSIKFTRVLARSQPCGCITCWCEDDVQCQGCGAKSCGGHEVGEIPNPIFIETLELSGKALERTKNLLCALGHQGVDMGDGQTYDIGEWGIKEAQELHDLITKEQAA